MKTLALTNTFKAIMHFTLRAREAFTSAVSCLISGSRLKKIDEETFGVLFVWWAFINAYISLPIKHFCNGFPAFIVCNRNNFAQFFSEIRYMYIRASQPDCHDHSYFTKYGS